MKFLQSANAAKAHEHSSLNVVLLDCSDVSLEEGKNTDFTALNRIRHRDGRRIGRISNIVIAVIRASKGRRVKSSEPSAVGSISIVAGPSDGDSSEYERY